MIVVLLTAPNFANPLYASNTTPPEIPPDCTTSKNSNTTTPFVLRCEIDPSDNGFVDNLLPTKSFGGSGVLIVQNVPSVPVSKTYAFLKFDMTRNLPLGLLQSGASPENASLRMYVRLMNFFYNATVEIHNASAENWTEKTLTWNTMPYLDPNNFVSLNIIRNGTWAKWDVRELVGPLSNSSTEIAFAAISSETSWRNLIWFDSDEYPLANGTTSPTLDLTFVEPYLTIQTPFPDIAISVAGNTLITGADGSVKLPIPWGNYAVSVPNTISIGNGTRAQFVHWSDRTNSSSRMLSIGNNVTLSATYGTQHELIASSPYGTISGPGWYFENTEAKLSVNPNAVPVEGMEGWLGARHIFDHWTGACTGTTPQCNVLMSNPEYTAAIWRVDWSQTEIAAAILIISAVLLTFVERRRGRRSAKTRKKKTSHSRRTRTRSRPHYGRSSTSRKAAYTTRIGQDNG